MPQPGIYYGTCNSGFSGICPTKDGREVTYMDLKFAVTHRQEGEGWVQCEEQAYCRLFLEGKSEETCMKILKQMGFNTDFENPQFAEPGQMLKAWHQNGYTRWQVQFADGGSANNDKKVEGAVAARLKQRFLAIAGGQSPAAAPVAVADPAPAPVAPEPTAPAAQPTTQQQLGAVAAPPAPPSGPQVLPGQEDEEEVPF